MTLVQDDSDLSMPPDGAGSSAPPAPPPAVEPDAARASGAGGGERGGLSLAAAVSLALHLVVAALFLLGPAGDRASTRVAGIRNEGNAASGDAKSDKADTGRKPGKDGAISVVLTPPPPARPKAPVTPAAPPVPKPPAESRVPSFLSAKTGPPAAAPTRKLPDPPDRPEKTAEKPPAPAKPERPPAQPKKTEAARTFRQPFLLPADGGVESWRGALAGSRQGRSASTAQGAADTGSGDAAVSNYPGRVARKLGAALRYPAGAKAARLSGEATVHFAVDGSGRATAVSIVASSGFDVLDKAAIAAVGRASPFPPIPAAAGRTVWPFTVTLAFGK